MNKKYNKVVGCGGIGKGMLFYSPVMETLGRTESRLVTLTDAKDYCKLQIVFYYPAVLSEKGTAVIPIGAVGDDMIGTEMTEQLSALGMDTSYIARDPANPTMLSICLQYPDKDGGNFTTMNSAAAAVSPEYIAEAAGKAGLDENTIVAAIPEVSVDARHALLKCGRAAGCFNVASVTVSEAAEFAKKGIYKDVDLLSLNEEEAQAVCGMKLTGTDLFDMVVNYAAGWNPDITVAMTAGARGAIVGDRKRSEVIPPCPADVVNTTGAGDAFIGTLIAMIAQGISLYHEKDAVLLYGKTAPEIASVAAALAVESEDSIPYEVTGEAVEKRAALYSPAAPNRIRGALI